MGLHVPAEQVTIEGLGLFAVLASDFEMYDRFAMVLSSLPMVRDLTSVNNSKCAVWQLRSTFGTCREAHDRPGSWE